MKLSLLVLSAFIVLSLMLAGCAGKSQEQPIPPSGAVAPTSNTSGDSVPGQQEGELKRFKRP